MRAILQEKLTEDQISLVKEREKTKALFTEVVRLGEQQERSNEIIQTLNLQLETRLGSVETKIGNSDRGLMNMLAKGENGLNHFNDWNDKMDKKLQILESNLYNIGVTLSCSLILSLLILERTTPRQGYNSQIRNY